MCSFRDLKKFFFRIISVLSMRKLARDERRREFASGKAYFGGLDSEMFDFFFRRSCCGITVKTMKLFDES